MWGVDNIRAVVEYAKSTDHIKEVGITTNLWDFYKRPYKWVDIFKDPIVDVCTSFQYGNQRRISKDRVFDQHTFVEIYNLYKRVVGKPLSFIYVVDNENATDVDRAIELAKQLGTTCKINGKFISGRSTENYRLADLYKIYQRIILRGDQDVEDNSCDIVAMIQGQSVNNCCVATNCDQKFRVVDSSGIVSMCSINANNIDRESVIHTPFNLDDNITNDRRYQYVSSRCFDCIAYRFCNNCKVTVKGLKQLTDKQLDDHCQSMKSTIETLTNHVKNHCNCAN